MGGAGVSLVQARRGPSHMACLWVAAEGVGLMCASPAKPVSMRVRCQGQDQLFQESERQDVPATSNDIQLAFLFCF